VPSKLYNHIIGTRGAEIKTIQTTYKVSVHVPTVDSINRNVVIVGDPVGTQGARDHIQKIVDKVRGWLVLVFVCAPVVVLSRG